jgi:phytoene desaturase
MAERSVVIIGAGLAGLAAGVYAQLNGYRATILEHASQPGGVAVGWRHGGYRIDGGIHFLMGHRPGGALYRLYEEVGAASPGMCADMDSYGDFADEASGRRLHLTADLDRFVEDWSACSPADRQIMADTVSAARAFARAGAFDMGLGDPPELAGRLGMLKQMWGMRRVFRYFGGQHNRTAEERSCQIQDPFLRDVYANLFLPEVPAWFLYMVLGLMAERQMGLLLDGSTGFVAGIERRFRELGGAVHYGATVDQISVVNNRATGAHVVSGDWVMGDAVISAADGYSTIFGMLGGRYADQATRARYRDWPLIRPMVMISFGVNRSFAGEPHLRAFRLARPILVGQQNVSLLALRIFNYSDRFAPAGKTVIQATFDAEWDHWRGLRDDKAAYVAEKERVAAEVLARLGAHFPGLARQVEVTDVATPYTTWRYTLNRNGAYEGWLPTTSNLMTTLPRTLPGLAGFYMAGQWVIPGGGVPTCIASGRDAVRIMCDRDDVPFRSKA